MRAQFPPPDPHESFDLTAGLRILAPMAIFATGPAGEEADRVADRVLELRPGIFVVTAPE